MNAPESVLEFTAFTCFFVVALGALSVWLCRTRNEGRLVCLAWLLTLLCLVPGWFLVQGSEAQEKDRLIRAIAGFAPTYAAEFEALGHQRIGLDTPPDDPLYLMLLEKQKGWLALNPHVADIYTFRKHADGNELIVDSETDYNGDGVIDREPDSREVQSPIGKLWKEKSPLLEKAFAGEQAFESKPYEDFWGIWVSAYVPMRDDKGDVEAVLGVDYDAGDWAAALQRARWLVLGALAVALVCALSLITVFAVLRSNLRERERGAERTRKVIDQAHDAFVAMDEQSIIIDWNPQSSRVFGWSRDEALGKELPNLIMPERFRSIHRAAVARYLETGVSHVVGKRIDVTGQHKDGHEIQLEMTIAAIPEGSSFRFHAFLHDITERVQNEANLRDAKDAAEAATRAKSEFIASVSHEIRTPLNGILGMSELLATTELDARQAGYLAQVRRSSDTLLHLINDVLDMSKIEAGKIDLELRAFDLRAAMLALTQSIVPRAEHKGLSLEHHVAPEVPRVLRGDPGRLAQVLGNLLSNAVKFTNQGGIRVAVALETKSDEDVELRFSVTDTGIGIPPDRQNLIFDAFKQEDASTTRRYGGTGLGLSICRHLVARMGGRIHVTSELGRGSTFTFTSRFSLAELADVEADSPTTASDRVGIEGAPIPLPPQRILLAEDGQVNQEVAVGLLELDGHHVDVVENGALAVEAVGRTEYDLVLMDLQMPVMDGLDATRTVRANEGSAARRVPIIALTAIAMKGDRDRCLRAGMDAYVSKPIDRDELRETMRGVLARTKPDTSAPPEEIAPTEGLVDWRGAAQRIPGGPDGIRKLADMMRTEAPHLLQEIRAGLAEDDVDRVRLAAHTLRGSARYFDAHEVIEQASEAEGHAHANNLPAIKALLPELEELVARFVEELATAETRALES